MAIIYAWNRIVLFAGHFRVPRFYSTYRTIQLLAMWMLLGKAQAGNAHDANPTIAAQVSNPSSDNNASNSASEINGFVITITDEVHNLHERRIKWKTYWTLCWNGYPQAVAYQIETMTGEGKSPQLIMQQQKCKRIEIASGENKATLGLVNLKTAVSPSPKRIIERKLEAVAELFSTRCSSTVHASGLALATAPQSLLHALMPA